MRELTIYRLYATESNCYRSGVRQVQVGVQAHSTGANNPRLKRYVGPDDGRLGGNTGGNGFNRPGGSVCPSACIGRLADWDTVACYQLLPWEMRCWLSANGKNGNANRLGYIGFEICEDNLANEAYFREAVMGVSVNLTAHLCELLGVSPGEAVRSFADGRTALAVADHAELHASGVASNHADITHWLERYGLTMDDYRDEVAAAMAEGVRVTYIDALDALDDEDGEMITMYQARATNPGSYLNLRANKTNKSNSIAKITRGDLVDVLDDTDPVWWLVRYPARSAQPTSGVNAGVYAAKPTANLASDVGRIGYAMAVSGEERYLTRVETEAGDSSAPVPDPEPVGEMVAVALPRELVAALVEALNKAVGG